MRKDRGPQLTIPVDAKMKAQLEAAAARGGGQSVASLVMRALDGERDRAAASRPIQKQLSA
jgi:hypothetical protein